MVTAFAKMCPGNRQQQEELVNLDKQVMMRLHQHKQKCRGGTLVKGVEKVGDGHWQRPQETQGSSEGQGGRQAHWCSLGGSIQTLPGVPGTE